MGAVHNHPAKTHTEGIQPDCPRCAEYVKEPTQLDGENLRRIWSGRIYTAEDMEVYNTLYRAVVLTQRLSEGVAWRSFEPGVHDIATFTPEEKPSQYELFQFGGRR